MIFFIKKIYYSIFSKNYNFTKTIINQYYTNKKKIVFSFSSIGRGAKYIQTEEFFNLTKLYNVFFVRDTTRSWFNNIDIELIKKNIAKKKIFSAVGYSMGAFNAIIFSSLFKVKKVVAISPQFSIHPKISKDKTFLNYAARIKEWKYPQLKFSKDTNYLLIFGDSDKEKYHSSLIPVQKNIKIIYIKNSDHETLKRIKRSKKMYKIIYNFLDNN
jgi:esterase/lipase